MSLCVLLCVTIIIIIIIIMIIIIITFPVDGANQLEKALTIFNRRISANPRKVDDRSH